MRTYVRRQWSKLAEDSIANPLSDIRRIWFLWEWLINNFCSNVSCSFTRFPVAEYFNHVYFSLDIRDVTFTLSNWYLRQGLVKWKGTLSYSDLWPWSHGHSETRLIFIPSGELRIFADTYEASTLSLLQKSHQEL